MYLIILFLWLVRNCDEFVLEQAKSVIYASARMDVPELSKVRELLVEKYTASILPDREIGVYPRLVLKLAMSYPERGLCEKYLEAIADSFGIDWASSEDVDGTESHGNQEKEREDALLNLLSSSASSHSLSSSPEPAPAVSPDTPPAKAPPATKAPAPLPMDYSKQNQQQQQQQHQPLQPQTKQNLPDFDEFTRRFEALRKK